MSNEGQMGGINIDPIKRAVIVDAFTRKEDKKINELVEKVNSVQAQVLIQTKLLEAVCAKLNDIDPGWSDRVAEDEDD